MLIILLAYLGGILTILSPCILPAADVLEIAQQATEKR